LEQAVLAVRVVPTAIPAILAVTKPVEVVGLAEVLVAALALEERGLVAGLIQGQTLLRVVVVAVGALGYLEPQAAAHFK
jgi:hypothetical protein